MDFGLDILGIRFLTGNLDLMIPYAARYSIPLVLLSYLFAFAGSFAGLTVCGQIQMARKRNERLLWLGLGAAAMGCAVWSMHFVGMLAYQLPFSVAYALNQTLISAIPSIGASLVVLFLLSRETVSWKSILSGGAITGAGIGAMHFIGMDAMRANASMGYDPVLFAVSIAVAVVLAIIALSARTEIRKFFPQANTIWSNTIAAATMGVAISGMHYTAMLAVTFYEGSLCARPDQTIDGDIISLVGIGILFAFLMLVLFASVARRMTAKSALLSAIMNNSLDGIIVSDTYGKITLGNNAAKKMFGLEQNELTGRDFANLFMSNNSEARDKKISSIFDGDIDSMASAGQTVEVIGHRLDGTRFPAEVGLVKVPLEDESVISATIRDITPRRTLEQAQRQAYSEVSTALQQQTELNESQRQFIAMASHEFRTPLAVIDSSVRRLLRKKDNLTTEELLKRTGRITSAVTRLIALMESTLSSSRLDSGKLEISLSPCDITSIVNEACIRQQDVTPGRQIIRDLTDFPSEIQADATALDQIITNLLSNAVKYSPDASDIIVKGWSDENNAFVSVRDFGLGIDEEDQKQLFTRFFRAKTAEGIEGTGIGLHLAKGLIEEHDGTLEVTSKIGEGSTFTITLPAAS